MLICRAGTEHIKYQAKSMAHVGVGHPLCWSAHVLRKHYQIVYVSAIGCLRWRTMLVLHYLLTIRPTSSRRPADTVRGDARVRIGVRPASMLRLSRFQKDAYAVNRRVSGHSA
jgi:hypothetical protein